VPPTSERPWTETDRAYEKLRAPIPKEGDIVEVDVAIVGSGAGGAAAAWALARRGLKVAILEAGEHLLPRDLSQREDEMYPRLFYDGGGRRTANRAIRVLHGHGVGGSTLHNINLCKRAPDELLRHWAIPCWGPEELRPFYEQVEHLLDVREIELAWVNKANGRIRDGVKRLGWKGGALKHNRRGCVGSGFCELGCAFDAKMNASRVLIPEAAEKGALLFPRSRAVTLELLDDAVTAVRVRSRDPRSGVDAEWKLAAKKFICAGGAVESPLLLQRSGVPDPYGRVGRGLRLHPGAAVAGVFEDEVRAWQGIPQSWECTEWLSFDPKADRRVWIVGGSAHPAGAAGFLPGFGPEHAELMALYPRIVPLSAMLHDESEGFVSAGLGGGVSIDYVLTEADRVQLATGLQACARILFAAGASEVIVPTRNLLRLKSVTDIGRMPTRIEDHELDLVAVHPMGSLPLGLDAKTSACRPDGRLHGLENLGVADTSLFPTSLGVPPQITAYATGLTIGEGVGAFSA
ncbi:MAG: GMC family oxidoreductase, partial [Bdellovibrionales bacterium]|nr:GMC family oxidoreductase [Bdellovibrionales bacterium]